MKELNIEELCIQIYFKWNKLGEKLAKHEIESIEYATRRRYYERILWELCDNDDKILKPIFLEYKKIELFNNY
jgi:hypothetical protein